MKHSVLLFILLGGLAGGSLQASPRPTAAELIQHFNMARIPQEGPWFTLTYSSSDTLARGSLPERYKGSRAAGSAIIAIITRDEFSAMHRLQTDEVWHYYGGDPLQLLVLHPNGSGEVVVLGSDVLAGQKLQYVVPRGSWQGSMPLGKARDRYAMIGDTLAPGFDYSDFEMGYRAELQQAYPRYADLIAQLTRQEFLTRPHAVATSPPPPLPTVQEAAPIAVSVDQLKTVEASPDSHSPKSSAQSRRPTASAAASRPSPWEAGKRSSTSFNKDAEEYFIVTEGTGTVRVGARETTVIPGSVVVVPPRAEHSLQAGSAGSLRFYAVSAPAFRPEDYVVTSAPIH